MESKHLEDSSSSDGWNSFKRQVVSCIGKSQAAFSRRWHSWDSSWSFSMQPVQIFWGYVKDQVFRPKVGSVVELCARISNAVASVTPRMLENICREIEYRLDIFRATDGAHIEMYWTSWVVLSNKANQFSISRILCVLCVYEMWWINCGHSVSANFISSIHVNSYKYSVGANFLGYVPQI
jgi:hypothetical protein